jgi:RNA 3'-terminal phosphate cyclase (ATP)
MTGAEVKGLYQGSTEVDFKPGPIKAGEYMINMGTAGSITLALQSILPIAAYASGPVKLDITGGTDVKWSPTYDYFANVTIPALRRFGVDVETSLQARGFFPVGNGRVIIHIRPAALRGAELVEPSGDVINGVSSSSRLPSHVAGRQAKAAAEKLRSLGLSAGEIRLDVREDISTGSSITLFKGYAGGSSLGERGKPAEKVGAQAASILADEIKSGAAVDAHLADQLIIYMALASGPSSISVSQMTDHTASGIRVAGEMTGKEFKVIKNKVTIIRSSDTGAG